MKKFLMILLPAVFMAGFISCKSNEVQAEEAKTEDYLLSNVAMEKRRDILIEGVKDRPFFNEQYKKDLIEVFSAKIEYLEEAINTINSKYGGVISYLENVLNVDIKKIRSMYLQ